MSCFKRVQNSVVCLICVSLFLIPNLSKAATVHVPAEQTTIQAGILAATSGDTVLVADGVYTGAGNRDIDFFGKSVVLRSVNGPAVTIIDCQGDTLDPHRGFIFQTGEDSTAVLEGFTIRGGLVVDDKGAGILIENSHPTIKDCNIVGNIAYFDSTTTGPVFAAGGGVSCKNSSPRFLSCAFSGNSAHVGGAMFCYDNSNVELVNCSFESNSTISGIKILGFGSGSAGGGVYCVNSILSVRNCSFENNTAHFGAGVGGASSTVDVDSSVFINNLATPFGTFDTPALPGVGGAMAFSNSTSSVSNSTFIGNISSCDKSFRIGMGAAVFLQNSSQLSVASCTFFGNISQKCGDSTDPGGIGAGLLAWNSSAILQNSIIAFSSSGNAVDRLQLPPTDDSVILICCNIFGNEGGDWVGFIADQESENGNFSLDPLFCDTTTLDLGLEPGSPCVSGNNTCLAQIGSSGIGCENANCCDLAGDSNNDSSVNIADVTFLIGHIFAGGMALPCSYEADANGSGSVNIADVTYLIARIFAGGLPPVCGSPSPG